MYMYLHVYNYAFLFLLQLISLGAGFDTSFFRLHNQGLLSNCRVFEVRQCYSCTCMYNIRVYFYVHVLVYILLQCIYSTEQRQGILCLRFDRGSAAYEPRSKRGETRRNRGLNEAQPRSERGATAV